MRSGRGATSRAAVGVGLGLGLAAGAGAMFLASRVGKPAGVRAFTPFDSSRYLGAWYEIARFDYVFEKGMTDVTAHYSLRPDGGIEVVNRGYQPGPRGGKWKQSTGKAYFVDGPATAHLKVSFFGPFYASYIVIDLDANYQHALVCGPDRSYLWLLARSPVIDAATRQHLIAKAQSLGFDTEQLVWVSHDQAARA